MTHAIYRIIDFEIVGPYQLKLRFDDGVEQVVDFKPILVGEVYGKLLDEKFFNQVSLDPEVHTIAWPNGADFDPETLHDWPKYEGVMREKAQNWAKATA